MKRISIVTFLLLIFGILLVSAEDKDKDQKPDFDSLEKCAQFLYSMEESYSKVKSYKSLTTKRIRITKELRKKEIIEVYFMKPYSIRLNQLSSKKKMQVIYQRGANNGKMLVQVETLFGKLVRIKLDPECKLARKNQLRTIKEASIGYVIKLINSNIRKGVRENKLSLEYLGSEEKFDSTLYIFEGKFSGSKDDGFFCKKATLKIDSKLILPREIIIFDWDGKIREWYEYLTIEINPGLTEQDFKF
ncbi:DUF1571 domain-containing protein [Candidatus Dependentiae bacterium]|nr:DUF1571 domain-containing protein [Candidatus Dependentiae bacterium]